MIRFYDAKHPKYLYVSESSEGIAQAFSFKQTNSTNSYIDVDGNELFPKRFYDTYEFKNGSARVAIAPKTKKESFNNKLFINRAGGILFAATVLNDFSEGLAAFGQITGFPVKLKFGFIDRNFQIVIKPEYSYVKDFSEGLAVARIGNLYGFIDKKGNPASFFQYKQARSFHEGLAAVQDRNGLWAVIDSTGKRITYYKYEEIGDFKNGYAPAKLQGNWGLIDKTGKTVIPFEYYEVILCENNRIILKDSDALANNSALFTLIDGKLTAVSDNYFEIEPMANNLYRTTIYNGKNLEGNNMSVIDENGKKILWHEYSDIRITKDGYIEVEKIEKNGFRRQGLFTRDGKIIIPCKYSKVSYVGPNRVFVITPENDSYIIDFEGNIVKDLTVYTSMVELDEETVFITADSQEELALKKLRFIEIARKVLASRLDATIGDLCEEVYELNLKK